MIEIFSYLATALVLAGVYYCAKPRLRGQIILVFAETSWLIYAVGSDQWALAFQSLILWILSLWAVKNWAEEKIKF